MKIENISKNIDKIKEFLIEQKCIKEDLKDFSGHGFNQETMFDIFISKTIKYATNTDEFIECWLKLKFQNTQLQTELIPINKIKNWHIDADTGNIHHDSERFFTITGLKVRHRTKDEEIIWDQPIIDQPEVGILGILARKMNGVLHLCLQAKEEPGNINLVQLSPTVQATYSNYSKVHGGTLPPFVKLFLEPPKEKILFAKLQTEDGGRFLFKSNRNMIVWADEKDIAQLPDHFIWLTLRQIGQFIKRDNLINSCARSVLSCLI